MANKGHSSGNGHQAKALQRELASLRADSTKLNARIDAAVALADSEIGFDEPRVPNPESRDLLSRATDTGHWTPDTFSSSPLPPLIPTPNSQLPVLNMPGANRTGMTPDGSATNGSVPPLPAPEKVSLEQYAARIEAGWVPVVGIPGTPITGGFLRELGEYNPKMEGLNAVWTYQEMRRGCSQVASTLDGCKAPILSAEWQVKPVPNNELKKGQTAAMAKETADFIRNNLFSGLEWQDHRGSWHTQNWKDVVRIALRMLDFGAAAYEEILTIDGDRIRARKLADRQALTFYRWHTDPHEVDPDLPAAVYDDGETLYAIEQWGYRGGAFKYVKLPMDKACLFTREQEGANFWGIPLTRAMYPHWYIRMHCERLNSIVCERNGMGVPVILLPPNPSKQDVATAQNWVTKFAVHEATGLSLPNGAQFLLVGVTGQVHDILPFIEYEDTQISKRGFMEFQQLGQKQSGSGSKAVGGVQSKFFYLSSQITADDVAATLRNSTVRRLVMFNFGADAPVPYLIPANVQARSLEEAAPIIKDMADGGAWISDLSSINKTRGQLGYDALTSKELSDDDVVLGPRITIPGNPAMMPAQPPSADSTDSTDQGAGKQQPGAGGKKAEGGKQKAADGKNSAQSGQSVETLARQAAQPLVAPPSHPSPFFKEGDPEHLRNVYPHEAHVDFPGHWKALRTAEGRIAGALRADRPRTIRAMANQMAGALIAGQKPGSVNFTDRDSGSGISGLGAKLKDILTPLYSEAGKSVQDEHSRLWEDYRKTHLSFGSMTIEGEKRQQAGWRPSFNFSATPESQGGLFAEIAAQFYDEGLGNDASNAGISMLKKYGGSIADQDAGELADELFGAISDNSDGFIDQIADQSARGTFRKGRGDAFDQLAEELRKQGYELKMIRVCAMEKDSCDPCEMANGRPLAPGEDITAIHEGPPDTCECMAVESI